MASKKGPRVTITLECLECRETENSGKKRRSGVSRYLSSKNRRTTTERIELKKYCKYCNKHTVHKELKN
jgi:large subunit ribosomal protein L33